jgi:hypothetical protein
VKNSLYGLGLPIVQGAVSTILGVIGLVIAPSYIFITFFKMIFLVITLGALHGLFLLPVLLSLFGPGSCSSASAKEEDEKKKKKNKNKADGSSNSSGNSKLKSPTTSYLSEDGDSSLPSSSGGGGNGSGSGDNVGEGKILRIPRPATTTTTSTTDVETSGSSPGSGGPEKPGGGGPGSRSVGRSASSGTGGRPEQRQRRTRRRSSRLEDHRSNLHEMYHNNGYLSEEEDEADEEPRVARRGAPRGDGGGSSGVQAFTPQHFPVMYYNNYSNGAAGGLYAAGAAVSTYAQPIDRQPVGRGGGGGVSGPPSRHQSRDRNSRSQSRECRRKTTRQ